MPPRKKLPDYRGYIQIDLTEQDIATLEASKVTPEEMLSFLHSMCRQGYSFAMSCDPDTKAARCVVTDTDDTRTSAGWKLSGEGQSVPDSLLTVMYKHTSRMGGDWRPFCNQAREVKKFR